MAFCAFVEKFIVAVVRSVSGWGKKKKKGGSSLLLEEEEGVCVRVGVERRFFVCVRRLYV